MANEQSYRGVRGLLKNEPASGLPQRATVMRERNAGPAGVQYRRGRSIAVQRRRRQGLLSSYVGFVTGWLLPHRPVTAPRASRWFVRVALLWPLITHWWRVLSFDLRLQ